MGKTSLSVILPTINEAENLKVLIPSLFKTLESRVLKLEVIVVDDGSTDDTREVLDDLANKYSSIIGIFRKPIEKSLPRSIQIGINAASNELVAWMDADGSMTADVLSELLDAWQKSVSPSESIVIASRFAEGGFVKGASRVGPLGFLQAAKNLHNTEDSFLAVVLSWSLNQLLYLALGKCCEDATSGFALGPRSFLKRYPLRGTYGDYFPRLMYEVHKSNKTIIEIPYKILVRLQGTSKTGTTAFEILRSGLPYLRVLLVPLRYRRRIKADA